MEGNTLFSTDRWEEAPTSLLESLLESVLMEMTGALVRGEVNPEELAPGELFTMKLLCK